MASELTEEEMKLDRRAEEIEKDMFSDWSVFSEWLSEEFAPTEQSVMVHKLMTTVTVAMAGATMESMYKQYCETEANKRARGEL